MINGWQEECDAVQRINEELYEKHQLADGGTKIALGITVIDFFCEIKIYFFEENIELLLYNSENNDRIYNDKSDEYESIYVYLKRKFKELKKLINSVKM